MHKLPEEVLDYSLYIGEQLLDAGDAISSFSVAMSPSNAPGSPVAAGYDAQPTAVSAFDGIITAWIGGGVAGRLSTALFTVLTTGGRIMEFRVRLPIGPSQPWSPRLAPYAWPPPWYRLPTPPIPAPYSVAYGPAQTLSLLINASLVPMRTATGAYIALATSS